MNWISVSEGLPEDARFVPVWVHDTLTPLCSFLQAFKDAAMKYGQTLLQYRKVMDL